MANYKMKDADFISPDLDVKKLTIAMKKFLDRSLAEPDKTEYNGTLMYKVTGNKVMTITQTISREVSQTFFEINHAVADPFRDEDVDEERMKSRGLVDRSTIEKRNLLFVQSDELYQPLYIPNSIEEVNNLATFLLRIPHKGENKPSLESSSKVVFAFQDIKNLRGPIIKTTAENQQKVPPTKIEEKPSKSTPPIPTQTAEDRPSGSPLVSRSSGGGFRSLGTIP